MKPPSPSSRVHAPADPAKVRVLVLEDDPLDAELMVDALRDDGMEVESRVVDNEAGFREGLREFGPDVVLSDLSLPGYSGTVALRALRVADSRTPFIFVSGTIGEANAIEALREGATDYILKSNPARLASAVRRAMTEAAERRAHDLAEAELVRAQRFETLAILAGSLGHDLRNTLQPVLIANDLIARRSAESEIERLCSVIRDGCDQSMSLVRAMMDLARGGQGRDDDRIRVAALLDAVAMLLRPSVPAGIELVLGSPDPGLELPGKATELQQCLLNLALNAVQAMPDGGRLEISAEPFAPGDDFFRPDEQRNSVGYIRLSVTDTGVGMDAATLAQLFTPFFTTREIGTGLGLVSCKRLVQNHRGLIRVDSEPGKGSRFDVYLPVDAAPAVDHEQPTASPEVVPILVISGDRQERENLEETLDLYGYRPIVADSVHEALAHLSSGIDPAVAIVDRDLLAERDDEPIDRRLREAGFDGAFIVLGAVDPEGRRSPTGVSSLPKPVRAARLLSLLAEVMDSP